MNPYDWKRQVIIGIIEYTIKEYNLIYYVVGDTKTDDR